MLGLIGYLSVLDPSIVTLKARDKTCGCLCDIPLKHTWYRLYYNKDNRLLVFFIIIISFFFGGGGGGGKYTASDEKRVAYPYSRVSGKEKLWEIKR